MVHLIPASQLGIRALVYEYLGFDKNGSRTCGCSIKLSYANYLELNV